MSSRTVRLNGISRCWMTTAPSSLVVEVMKLSMAGGVERPTSPAEELETTVPLPLPLVGQMSVKAHLVLTRLGGVGQVTVPPLLVRRMRPDLPVARLDSVGHKSFRLTTVFLGKYPFLSVNVQLPKEVPI